MVTISNQQRDLAVEFLRQFLTLTEDKDRDSIRVTNLRRRAGILAKQLEKRPTTPYQRGNKTKAE